MEQEKIKEGKASSMTQDEKLEAIKLRPAPMPAALQSRLAEAMEGEREEKP